jgi:hypothetical protein
MRIETDGRGVVLFDALYHRLVLYGATTSSATGRQATTGRSAMPRRDGFTHRKLAVACAQLARPAWGPKSTVRLLSGFSPRPESLTLLVAAGGALRYLLRLLVGFQPLGSPHALSTAAT